MDTTTIRPEELLKQAWNSKSSQPWEWAFDVDESLPKLIVENPFLTPEETRAALDCWHEKIIASIDKVLVKANGVKQQQLEAQVDQVQMSWKYGPFNREPVMDWMKYHKLASITVQADSTLTYVTGASLQWR